MKKLKFEGYQVDFVYILEFLIIELVVDIKNIGCVDGYEFIEIYNMIDRMIDFKDYYICYCYLKEGFDFDLIWRLEKKIMILFGEMCVVWLKFVGYLELMMEDFN